MSLQQTDFNVETGLPRYGCMFMSLAVAAFRAAVNRDPTLDEILTLYNDCLVAETPRWVNGDAAGTVPVLEIVDHLTHEIYINNPSAVVQKALSYIDPGWRGGQIPDMDLMAPQQMPRDFKLTYTLLNFRRASADGHWVLGDRSGRNIIYDPDENLSLDYWSRSPKWRGLRIYRV